MGRGECRAEVRILDNAELISKRIAEHCHANASANVWNRTLARCADGPQMLERHLDVRHAPQSQRAARARLHLRHIRVQSKLVPANAVPDVVRLVEVRLKAKRARVPLLRETNIA